MKIKTNIIGILLSSVFIISSCNELEEIGYANIGAEPILKTTSISSFDINQIINIEYFLKEGISITSASYNDSKIASQNLTVDNNKVSFNTSIKDSLTRKFNIITMLSNGMETTKNMGLSVHKPVEVSENSFVIQEDIEVDHALVFSNNVVSATIDQTITHWKKGENGTFLVANSADLNINISSPKSKDSINLRVFDYTAAPYNLIKRDTLFLMLISESGTLKDTIKTNIVFSPQSFIDFTNSITLTSDSKVNLMSGKTVTPDLSLNMATDQIIIENDTFKYVDISSETEVYKDDLLLVEDFIEVYNKYAAGAETSDALITASLSAGDLYIYSVERTMKDKDDNDIIITHYGLLSIDSVVNTEVDGVLKTSIALSSKEGKGSKN
jgi:hypothetical protein